jgi:predicted O-methyltransferase YrrM
MKHLSILTIVKEYINYKWKAKGRHGLHSPFVYDMVDRCFKVELPLEYKRLRQAYSFRLKKDHRLLAVLDAGAGSKHFGKDRKVSDIFKISASSGKYGTLLYRLVNYYKPQTILELGTSLGSGTLAMSAGNQNSQVHTVEACPQTLAVAREQFEYHGLKNIVTHQATFLDFLSSYAGPAFDLVFIDGHHDGEALKRYMDLLKIHTHDETFFVLDDIRWSRGMKKAYDELINLSDFHVSIDLFRVGILLPRKTQVKEHFVLKLPR